MDTYQILSPRPMLLESLDLPKLDEWHGAPSGFTFDEFLRWEADFEADHLKYDTAPHYPGCPEVETPSGPSDQLKASYNIGAENRRTTENLDLRPVLREYDQNYVSDTYHHGYTEVVHSHNQQYTPSRPFSNRTNHEETGAPVEYQTLVRQAAPLEHFPLYAIDESALPSQKDAGFGPSDQPKVAFDLDAENRRTKEHLDSICDQDYDTTPYHHGPSDQYNHYPQYVNVSLQLPAPFSDHRLNWEVEAPVEYQSPRKRKVIATVPVDKYGFVLYPEDDEIPVGGPIRRKERVAMKRKTRADLSNLPSQEQSDHSLSLQLLEGENIITENLVARLDFELKSRRITQSEFAKKVLNKGQGTLSVILTRPKPWKDLTTHGKVPYVRILEWILMSEKDKMRVVGEKYENRKKLSDEKKPKRNRIKFSEEQKKYLQYYFSRNPYPKTDEKLVLAKKMNLKFKNIEYFFINARKRAKDTDKKMI